MYLPNSFPKEFLSGFIFPTYLIKILNTMNSSNTKQLQRSLKSQGSRNTDRRPQRPKTDEKEEFSDKVSESGAGADDENDRQKVHRPSNYDKNNNSIVSNDDNDRGIKHRVFLNARNAHNSQEKDYFVNKDNNNRNNRFKGSREFLSGSSQRRERDSQRRTEVQQFGHQAEHGDIRRNDDERHRHSKKKLINKNVKTNINYYGNLNDENDVQFIGNEYKSTIHVTEPSKLPYWKEFDEYGFRNFIDEYDEYKSRGGTNLMSTFISDRVQKQARIHYYYNLLQFGNEELTKGMELFFKVLRDTAKYKSLKKKW